MGDRIVELVLHRGEKLLCDGAFHIVVGAALGIDCLLYTSRCV